MASLTMFAGITTGSSFYAKYSDGSSSYLGNYNSNNVNLYARGSYPSPLKYLRENGVVSASQTIKISSAKVSIKRSSGKNGSISLEARINNDNSVGGLTTGTATSITAANASGNSNWVTWTFTDSASLKALLQDTNVVVHIQANTAQSVHYFGFRNLSYNSQDRSIRLEIEYEIVEDSGSGDDSGSGGDDSGTTVNFNNTSMGNISDIDYGSTLSCTISGIPSNSNLTYTWEFKKPDGSFYYQNGNTFNVSGTSILTWKPDIDVGDYFSSSSKEQIGKLEVTIENPNAGDNKFSGSSYFTVTLTNSFGPTVPIISIGSTHTSGSYIPGSEIIWSANSTAQEGATIKKYTFSINGQTDIANSSSVNNRTADILPSNEGTYIATITATDSRGFTASTTRNITVSSKIAPTINASVIRCNSKGIEDPVEGANFLLSGTISADQTSGTNYITSVVVVITQTARDANDNVVTQTKKLSDSPSTTEYKLSNFGIQALPYSTDNEKKLSSFDIVITATDSNGTPAESILYGPAAAYIIHIAVGGKSLGLGSKAGLDKTITCGWNLISGGDLTVNGSVTLNQSHPLEVKYGGTGAIDAAGARTNLGITKAINDAIGSINLSNYAEKSDLTDLENSIENKGYTTKSWVQSNYYNSSYISTYYALKSSVPTVYYQTTAPSSSLGSSGDICFVPVS